MARITLATYRGDRLPGETRCEIYAATYSNGRVSFGSHSIDATKYTLAEINAHWVGYLANMAEINKSQRCGAKRPSPARITKKALAAAMEAAS